MTRRKNFQYVWPKENNPGESKHRGMLGRLNNILTGKGPDVFLQRKGSSKPITRDHWTNWRSFHDHDDHVYEEAGIVSRGYKRYDPHTRRYVEWGEPHDWNGDLTNAHGNKGYPRFTRDERRIIERAKMQGKSLNPSKIEGWTWFGPKRFRPEHDYFWQGAHRVGENYREGFGHSAPTNPFLSLGQQWPGEVDDWDQMGL